MKKTKKNKEENEEVKHNELAKKVSARSYQKCKIRRSKDKEEKKRGSRRKKIGWSLRRLICGYVRVLKHEFVS